MKIEKFDKNFAVNTKVTKKNIKYYDICQEPFKVYGILPPVYDGDIFRRMPVDISKKISEGVYNLATNASGGRVRFRTNSNHIGIHAKMPSDNIFHSSSAPLCETAGFDMYSYADGKYKYLKTFVPPYDIYDGYESEYHTDSNEIQDYVINFPIGSALINLHISLDEDAIVEKCTPYSLEKPIVFYGSSITQGYIASRPGCTYPNIVSRRFDADFINLGFAGNGKGEPLMAEYIAGLDMSVFVYDYDHNAPSVEHLKNTHKPMFDIVRNAHPDIPIICISRPVFEVGDRGDERRQIIMDTVESAKCAGDNNVYFIDGRKTADMLCAGDDISVDGCHPNDTGFMCIAQAIEKILTECKL